MAKRCIHHAAKMAEEVNRKLPDSNKPVQLLTLCSPEMYMGRVHPWVGFGWVGSGRVLPKYMWVGFGWVCWMGWVDLGQEIWTHIHLRSKPNLRATMHCDTDEQMDEQPTL